MIIHFHKLTPLWLQNAIILIWPKHSYQPWLKYARNVTFHFLFRILLFLSSYFSRCQERQTSIKSRKKNPKQQHKNTQSFQIWTWLSESSIPLPPYFPGSLVLDGAGFLVMAGEGRGVCDWYFSSWSTHLVLQHASPHWHPLGKPHPGLFFDL